MDKIIATAGSYCPVCAMNAVQLEEASSFISLPVGKFIS
jgi:hypothetical protein